MTQLLRVLGAVGLVAILCLLDTTSAAGQTFATSGRRFTYNGTAQFMVFVSYFGAVRHRAYNYAAFITSLNYLQAKGVKGIRVFPNWWGGLNPCTSAALNLMSTTEPEYVRQEWLDHLKALVVEAGQRGLVVDVSFAREPIPNLTMAQYKTALRKVTREFKNAGLYNAFFDVQNEANYPAQGQVVCNKVQLTTQEYYDLKAEIQSEDSTRRVTVSLDQNASGQLAGAAGAIGYDITSYHDPRSYPTGGYPVVPACSSQATTAPAWVRCTCDRVVDVSVGLLPNYPNTKPVYLQEPERSNTVGSYPDAFFSNALTEAAVRAKLSGAAAWTLHTEVSFLISGFGSNALEFYSSGFPAGLTSVEKAFFDSLAGTVNSSTYGWNTGYPGLCGTITP